MKNGHINKKVLQLLRKRLKTSCKITVSTARLKTYYGLHQVVSLEALVDQEHDMLVSWLDSAKAKTEEIIADLQVEMTKIGIWVPRRAFFRFGRLDLFVCAENIVNCGTEKDVSAIKKELKKVEQPPKKVILFSPAQQSLSPLPVSSRTSDHYAYAAACESL